MAISAVVAVGDAGDALVAKLKDKALDVKVGPGRDKASEMGPVVTPEARDRVTGYVDRGAQAGATLVVDGRGLTVDGHEDGFFVGPTLFDRVTTDMDIYADEIFGPVLVVLRARDLRRGHRTSSTPTRTATAPRSSPPAARRRRSSSATSRSG